MADTEATKANRQLVAMLPFEEAKHCEYFTPDERAAIMEAVERVKADAQRRIENYRVFASNWGE